MMTMDIVEGRRMYGDDLLYFPFPNNDPLSNLLSSAHFLPIIYLLMLRKCARNDKHCSPENKTIFERDERGSVCI